MSRSVSIAMLIAIAFASFGCANKSTLPPSEALSDQRVAGAAGDATNSAPNEERDFKINVGDTIPFEYDSYRIGKDAEAILSRQAEWLAGRPHIALTIEGHCDERGTREYNVGLGARRAASIKEYLVARGVSAARVRTISFGKERPVCSDTGDSCWAQNRRGVSVLAAVPKV